MRLGSDREGDDYIVFAGMRSRGSAMRVSRVTECICRVAKCDRKSGPAASGVARMLGGSILKWGCTGIDPRCICGRWLRGKRGNSRWTGVSRLRTSRLA